MIERIHITGFKSLRDVPLRLGALNLFVGANASGKSNFFDALRVIQGLAYGFTIHEVLDGKPKTSTSESWEAIRGGRSNASFRGSPLEQFVNGIIGFELEMRLPHSSGTYVYSIAFFPEDGHIVEEKLEGPGGPLYETLASGAGAGPTISARLYRGTQGRPPHVEFEWSRPILLQLTKISECPEEWHPVIEGLTRTLGDMQRVDPVPDVLREYSRGSEARRMGERGENYAALVNSILKDPSAASAYTAWLQQLTPTELDSIQILHGAIGEPLFALRKDGQTFAAPVLSDGTLRFAAIAAAFFQPDLPRILLIEEIEKGLHPTRLRLMMELLKSQARRPAPQVMATTHSPLALSWLDPEDYGTVFVCTKDEQTGASLFTPLSEIPHFTNALKHQPLAELFAEGWMEAAL